MFLFYQKIVLMKRRFLLRWDWTLLEPVYALKNKNSPIMGFLLFAPHLNSPLFLNLFLFLLKITSSVDRKLYFLLLMQSRESYRAENPSLPK